ncbi:hypothetical protein GEMRC1_009606 [Eukaryota sp. GEM-RC1]
MICFNYVQWLLSLETEVQNVFLHVLGTLNVEELLKYSNIISILELTLRSHIDLAFLNKSLFYFPRLKELHVCVDQSISLPLIELLKVNVTVTTVYLKNNAIGDEGTIALAEALKVNNTVTSINLSYNAIGDEGIIALAEALKVNNTVTSINLSYNAIGDEGTKALAEALTVNVTVELTGMDQLKI